MKYKKGDKVKLVNHLDQGVFTISECTAKDSIEGDRPAQDWYCLKPKPMGESPNVWYEHELTLVEDKMYKPKVGEIVITPQGKGKVKRVSVTQQSAHVQVGGQDYEVPFEDITPSTEVASAHWAINGNQITKIAPTDGVAWHPVKPTVTVNQSAIDELDDIFSTEYGGKETKPKEKPKEKKKVKTTLPDAMTALLGTLNTEVKEEIARNVQGELKELHDAVKRNQKLEVKVGDKSTIVKGMHHYQLKDLIKVASLRMHILLVGMAGTGKTHASEQVAEALKLPFYTMSVGAQTSKSDIIGYMNANGGYVKTFFREAYEKGGVFLMDEIDAGNANVLIQVNAALSNGLAAFPDAMVKKHKDFVFIASANTYGTGANRQYVGRNQLDAATLDRFTVIDWCVDLTLEGGLAVGEHGKAWHKAVRAARDYVREHNIRALITPRATQKGSQLLAAGFHVDQVINSTLLGSVPDDKKEDVTDVARGIFNGA